MPRAAALWAWHVPGLPGPHLACTALPGPSQASLCPCLTPTGAVLSSQCIWQSQTSYVPACCCVPPPLLHVPLIMFYSLGTSLQ